MDLSLKLPYLLLGFASLCVLLCAITYVRNRGVIRDAVFVCLVVWGAVICGFCYAYLIYPAVDPLFLAACYGIENSRELHIERTHPQLAVSNGDVLPQSYLLWYNALLLGSSVLSLPLVITPLWALDRVFLSGWTFRFLWEEVRPVLRRRFRSQDD